MTTKADAFRSMPVETLRRQRGMMTLEAMAGQYGVSRSTVYNHLRRVGVQCTSSRSLTEANVRVLRRAQYIVPISVLSRGYGIHQSTIRDIWDGKTWKWLV
jgi:predicted DNA-binding transcriptional regulator YafY